MRTRSYKDFFGQLAARKLSTGYIFAGDEPMFLDTALTALRDALLTHDFTDFTALAQDRNGAIVDETLDQLLTADRTLAPDLKFRLAENEADEAAIMSARQKVESFDYLVYHGKETDIDMVQMTVRTPPLTTNCRLVIVRDFDELRKDGQVRLMQLLAKKIPTCRLVLTTTTPAHDRKLARLLTEHKCADALVSIAPADIPEIDEFIDRWAKRTGIEVTRDARHLLIEMCNDSLSQVHTELNKLRTFLDDAKTITKETVRDLAGHWQEFEVNEFADAVARRDRTSALNLLWHLTEWDEAPVKIVAWLAGRFFRMLAYNYGDARAFSKAELTMALRHLSRIDLRLKQGYREGYYLLENFVITRTARRSQ